MGGWQPTGIHSPLRMPPKASRSWWRNEFYDHPGRAEKCDDAYVVATGGTTKVEKVYCIPCFDADVTEIIARDEMDLGLGRRNNVRSRDEITTHRTSWLFIQFFWEAVWLITTWNQVWSIQGGHEPPPDKDYGFLRYASSTLINHVKICPRQSQTNRAHARHEAVSPKKPVAPGSIRPNIQPLWPLAGPSYFPQHSPPYSQMLPPSVPSTRACSPVVSTPALSALPSPYTNLMIPMDENLLLSPAQSFSDHPAASISRSQSILALADNSGTWPPEYQSKFEERIARLTVSAGLPLSWVDNPEWIDFVNAFLPCA